MIVVCPAFAAEPQSELGLIGEFVQVDGHDNPWTVAIDLLFPVGDGHILIGPSAAIGQVDELNRLGGALEWNIAGKSKFTPFIGAVAH